MKYTVNDLKNSKVAHLNQHLIAKKRNKNSNNGNKMQKSGIKVPIVKKTSKALIWMKWNLMYWCNEHAVELKEEFLFSADRKFRFDFAMPAAMIAVEFEGGIFMESSGHNTAAHYTKDADKYNLAQTLGWKVFRYTALNYQNVIQDLNGHFATIS